MHKLKYCNRKREMIENGCKIYDRSALYVNISSRKKLKLCEETLNWGMFAEAQI